MIKRLFIWIFKTNPIRPVNVSEEMHLTYLMGVAVSLVVGYLRGLLFAKNLLVLGRGSRVRCSKMLRSGRGLKVGEFSSIDCWGAGGVSCGVRCSVGSYCILKVSGALSTPGKGLELGNNVGIGDFAHIGGSGGVYIGSNTITGAYLSIHPENHNFRDGDIEIRNQGVTRQGVRIGENCWIGAKVTFLDGSVIGDGCVVAAGTVVKGVFESGAILAGVPAKVIGRRVLEG